MKRDGCGLGPLIDGTSRFKDVQGQPVLQKNLSFRAFLNTRCFPRRVAFICKMTFPWIRPVLWDAEFPPDRGQSTMLQRFAPDNTLIVISDDEMDSRFAF